MDERRLPENAVNRLIYGKVQGIENIVLNVQREVMLTNGRVTVVEGTVDEHDICLAQIKKSENIQAGIRIGRLQMKRSTFTTLTIIISALMFSIAATSLGIREIRHHKSAEIVDLKQQLKEAEIWYKSHNVPATEGLPWEDNH